MAVNENKWGLLYCPRGGWRIAKRQMTWFRGMERRGFTINWIDALQPMEKKVEAVLELMRS